MKFMTITEYYEELLKKKELELIVAKQNIEYLEEQIKLIKETVKKN